MSAKQGQEQGQEQGSFLEEESVGQLGCASIPASGYCPFPAHFPRCLLLLLPTILPGTRLASGANHKCVIVNVTWLGCAPGHRDKCFLVPTLTGLMAHWGGAHAHSINTVRCGKVSLGAAATQAQPRGLSEQRRGEASGLSAGDSAGGYGGLHCGSSLGLLSLQFPRIFGETARSPRELWETGTE